jgi:hypothetical protein
MKDHEKWMELCAHAAKEQDPQKLMELTQEIIRLLDEKDARLKALRTADPQKP